jgi:hypothetical protein
VIRFKLQNIRKLFVLMCLVAGLIVWASQSQAAPQSQAQLIFDRANDKLENGNYREALSIYRTLEGQSRVSGALFLNMGISYVHIDSLGKAKYYFMKASRFDQTAKEAVRGLEYVESRFSRQSVVLPQLPWDRVVDWLRINLGASALLGIGLLLLNLGVAAFVLTWFYSPKFKSIIQKSSLILASVGTLFLLVSFYVQYVDQRYSEAVMIHSQGNVLEQPSPDAAIVNQAYEGYTFTVDHRRSEEHPGWSYIRMSNGLYGWIDTDDILIL